MDKLKDYLLGQLDKLTAWIGLIGLALHFLGFNNLLVFLFVALIILPESQFSDVFKKWTKDIRDADKKYRQ
ncbi:MAG: hypothetical protein U0800_12495 [Isosphaeraceae bacterium]